MDYLELKRYGFKDVESVYKTLEAKGHHIRERAQITAQDLIAIASDPDTVAILYAGHSLIEHDPLTKKPIPDKVYLSVYENGRLAALTTEAIERAKELAGGRYHPSPNLELFFTGSCHASYCERRIREGLELPNDVTVVAANGNHETSRIDIARSFDKNLRPWAEAMDHSDKTASCKAVLN